VTQKSTFRESIPGETQSMQGPQIKIKEGAETYPQTRGGPLGKGKGSGVLLRNASFGDTVCSIVREAKTRREGKLPGQAGSGKDQGKEWHIVASPKRVGEEIQK